VNREAREASLGYKLNLTIIILTNRNDQRFIRCLKSTQFAGEVLIFDYQSNNDWPALEKKYKFKVIKKDQAIINDFAKERNQTLKHAQNQWILFLDSDEIIEKDEAEKIEQLISQNEADAFYLKRVDYFHGQKLNWGEVKNQQIIRLAKKDEVNCEAREGTLGYKIKFKRTVHEVAKINGTVKQSNITIKHFAHRSINEFFDSICTYAYLEAKYRSKIKVSKSEIIKELLFYPTGKFIVNYFVKLGFLDGWRGLVYATMMSLHSLIVRIYLVGMKDTVYD